MGAPDPSSAPRTARRWGRENVRSTRYQVAQSVAVAAGKLAEQARHVLLDGTRGDVQPPGDLRVAPALGDQQEHLVLARGDAAPDRKSVVEGKSGDGGWE